MNKIILILSFIIIINPSFAFKPKFHEAITLNALTQDGFDEQTIHTVTYKNTDVDILHPDLAPAHGDNNELAKTSDRIRIFRDKIVNDLRDCKRGAAVLKLGEALHTVQDIYSHTNAVDNGFLTFIHGANMLSMSDGTALCSGEDGTFAPGGLVSGFFSVPAYGSALALQHSFEAADIASCYGTIPFVTGIFYIPTGYIEEGNCCHYHLNKDETGAINGGRSLYAQIEAVVGTKEYLNLIYKEIENNPDTHDDLEYYKTMLRKQQINRVYVIDTTGSMEEDIARLKTKLISLIDGMLAEGSTKAPTLGLVTFKDNEEDQIGSGFVCSRTSLESLKIRVNNLYAYGGDDCPEASAEALETALNYYSSTRANIVNLASERKVIVHTDAPSSNQSLFDVLELKAQERGVTVDTISTEGCSVSSKNNKIGFTQPYNQRSTKTYTKKDMLKFSKSSQEVYQDVAESTGGINMNVNKNELDKVIPISLFITETDTEIVYSQKTPVNSTNLTETLIKIDSSMSTGKTMIMVKTIDIAALPTITLSRPNGDIVLESDADITVNNLSTIVTYTIDSPIQGEWKVSLSNGTSSYLVRTYAQTDFGIARLSLLKEAPLNIRNVQFMPIQGNPIAGDELLLRLSLTQAPDTLTLKLLSENQTIILEPILTLVENSTKSYEATIVVPNENFKIKLEGMLNTSQFQREIALSLKPTEVLKQLSSYQMSMVS